MINSHFPFQLKQSWEVIFAIRTAPCFDNFSLHQFTATCKIVGLRVNITLSLCHQQKGRLCHEFQVILRCTCTFKTFVRFTCTFRCSCTLYVSVNLLLYAVRVRFVALVRCTCPLTYSCTLSAYVYSFVYAVRVRLSIYSIVRSTLIFSGFVRSTLNFSAFVRVKMPIVRVRLYPIIALISYILLPILCFYANFSSIICV